MCGGDKHSSRNWISCILNNSNSTDSQNSNKGLPGRNCAGRKVSTLYTLPGRRMSLSLTPGVLPSLICISIRLPFDSLLFLLALGPSSKSSSNVRVLSRIHLFLFASIQLCDLRWLPTTLSEKLNRFSSAALGVIEILCRSQLLLLFSVTEIDQKDIEEPIDRENRALCVAWPLFRAGTGGVGRTDITNHSQLVLDWPTLISVAGGRFAYSWWWWRMTNFTF